MLRFAAFALLAMVCYPALGQSDWQIFGGATYMRQEIAPGLRSLSFDHITAYGWNATVSEYPYRNYPWIGGTVDVSGVYSRPSITFPASYFAPGIPPATTSMSNLLSASAYTAMAGPTFAWRERHIDQRVEPFGRVMIGAVNQRISFTDRGRTVFGYKYDASNTSFGLDLGGGADVRLKSHVAVRGAADWIRTSFSNGVDDRQNNIRVSGGLVFRL